MSKILLVGACAALAAGAACSSSSDASAVLAGAAGTSGAPVAAAGGNPAVVAGAAGGVGGGAAASVGGSGDTSGMAALGGSPTSAGAGGSAEAGPLGPAPDFGSNVLIFDPTKDMAVQQAQIKTISDAQASAQFSTNRYALLFKPGKYQLDVKVGFYMQVLGLGPAPDDVQITGAVRARSDWNNGNATLNFWREAENFSALPTLDNNANVWAVSQGTALRRAHLKGPLNLSDGGYASGGYVADTLVDGAVSSGAQQQFFTRNAAWASWNGGVWNMLFSGTVAPPAGAWPAKPYTVVEKTPLIREKPYLSVDSAGHFFVNVPAVKSDTQGTSFTTAGAVFSALSTDTFYVAKPGDTSRVINAALASGKHLLLTPGIYHLDESLQIVNPGTVVFGLGLATLVPNKGTPALTIADVDGVEVAGVIVDAGPVSSPTLVQVGPPGSTASHSRNPSTLHDLFCRVGGGSAGTAASCMTVNSNDVIGDGLWLWRADHGSGAGWANNVSKNGLIVNGSNVTKYGLFVEHFQEYQVLWNGNGGRTFFYQSELPYDPPNQAAWQHETVNGFASYKVAATVTSHTAFGLGIYSAFRNPVACDNAIETPTGAGIGMHHLMTSWLNGNAGSAITHIINGTGPSAVPASHQANSAD